MEPAKIAVNPGMRLTAKAMLNSLWGRLGLRPNLPRTLIAKTPKDFFNIANNGRYTCKDFHIINNDTAALVYESKNAYVEENLPLTFDFFSLQGAASENSRLSIGTGPSMSIEAVLPAGDATKNNVLFVGVSVSDVLGTAVDMIRNVTVHPPADSTSRSFDQIEDLLESKEFAAAQGLVGAIAQTLNGGEAICAGIIEAECVTGACCARKKERLKLFYKLKQADSQMTATMKTIEDEMRVLQSITVRPEEISYVAAKEISKFVMDKFQRLKGITISKDVVDIAKSFGVVIDQISSSVVASVPDKVAVPYTLNEHHRSKDGAHVSRSTSLRSSITLDDARQLFCDLISMICEMSLLSVRQAESGQKRMNLQRVSGGN